MRIKRKVLLFRISSIFVLLALAGAGLLVFAAFHLPLPQRLSSPCSKIVEYREGGPAYVFLSRDDKWRLPVELDRVSPEYIESLICFEDKRFLHHPGIDPLAVLRSAYLNLHHGRIVSGASTITMQLVRILEPRPRTYRSKLIESFKAVQLELRMSKPEILNAYLQFLPFGKNIEGVESAAYAFFGHSVEALSPFETAYLLCVPQDPNVRYPSVRNMEKMSRAVDSVARKLLDAGVFSAEQAAKIRETPLPEKLHPYPRNAPHAAIWLDQRFPEEARLMTTLRKDIQQLAGKILQAYRVDHARKGIHNASVVVIENETGEVAALVGNFDFWDDEHHGQVIGFDAPRSPGSALKPFIYALAIDRAVALPSQLVSDIPVYYGSYEPRNYDEKFSGLVRLEDALSGSLNVPFVNLLSEIDVEIFLSFLADCGITTLSEKPGYYGLSVAIGGMEVSLIELTNLYRIFADKGRYSDYQVLASNDKRAGRQVLSGAAAYLTKQALKIRDRPDFPARRSVVDLPPQIHWKTGTSYGHKDAWSVGSNPEYTVGVWTGNFDGTPSIALVGSQAAGTMLFDILDALSNRAYKKHLPEPPPLDLGEIEVCAFSGYIPNPHCPGRIKVLAPVRNLPTQECPYHVNYEIDIETGYYLPPLCRAGRQWKNEVFTVLPPSIQRWVAENQLKSKKPPVQLPSCPYVVAKRPPKIVSPKQGAIYFLVSGMEPSDQEIPLEAEASNREAELAWFVNGRFLRTAPSPARVWLLPREGKHEIKVVDSAGLVDRVFINIMKAN